MRSGGEWTGLLGIWEYPVSSPGNSLNSIFKFGCVCIKVQFVLLNRDLFFTGSYSVMSNSRNSGRHRNTITMNNRGKIHGRGQRE